MHSYKHSVNNIHPVLGPRTISLCSGVSLIQHKMAVGRKVWHETKQDGRYNRHVIHEPPGVLWPLIKPVENPTRGDSEPRMSEEFRCSWTFPWVSCETFPPEIIGERSQVNIIGNWGCLALDANLSSTRALVLAPAATYLPGTSLQMGVILPKVFGRSAFRGRGNPYSRCRFWHCILANCRPTFLGPSRTLSLA